MHDLAHEFTSRKISPWGGIKFFQKTYVTTGVREFLNTLDLPVARSNRGYNVIDLLEGFMVSVLLGSRRLEHSGMLRTDAVIQEIFGWKKGIGSSSTYSRLFKKFSIERNDSVFPKLMRYWFDQMSIKKITIDIDSTVITRYGKQELASKGYNPEKRGKVSHHPLMAFCDELKMVVNAWMRSGDSHSSTNILDFLSEAFEIVDRKRIGLIRGDSGFYNKQIMNKLEEGKDEVGYIIRAKKTSKLMSRISGITDWYGSNQVVKGASYSEVAYRGSNWKKDRRMVIVRVPTEKRLSDQVYLFEQDQELAKYDYYAMVTNRKDSAVKIHQMYNQRGDCENRIKELKYDYRLQHRRICSSFVCCDGSSFSDDHVNLQYHGIVQAKSNN